MRKDDDHTRGSWMSCASVLSGPVADSKGKQ